MLAISAEFLHGTFRGDPTGTANTGGLSRGEWPPAPARLFAALVAADGTRENCRGTNGAELAWLERQPPPVIHAHPSPFHQRLEPRYVVEHGGSPSGSTHQEYVGRKGALHRCGVRVSPRDPCVVYSWDVEPPAAELFQALRWRAARVGYLGASDSPVRLRATTQPPAARRDDRFDPDPTGEVLIRVTEPGDLEVLDRMYDAWRQHGASVNRLQFPALRHATRYRSPGMRTPPVGGGEVVAWLRLGAAISGRRVSAITALFKDAVLSQYQRIHGEPPAVLHGHGFAAKGYDTARYLALPDVGYRWSRGRIHGLALWMPPGCDLNVRAMALDAARALRRLQGRGIDVSVALRDDEERPLATHPDRWIRRRSGSRGWATAFPAIHERRRTLDLTEVARWCRHAGLPEPVAFRSTRTPLVRGAADLAPVEVNRPGRPALPYSHVEVRFAEPVQGPVVVGSGRQRGFGLCVPTDD